MKNIIFIAPPAAGKGTQSDMLVKKYGYKHISTGDLLRNEISSNTKLGIEINNIINNGELVTDEIVTKLLEQTLLREKEPYILDGYPRNINQAIMLDQMLINLNKNKVLTIYLNVSKEEALNRATGRISCPDCKRSYHKTSEAVKPKVEGLCDDCNIELITRDDDNEETYKVRFKNFEENISPLLNYYKEKNNLYIVDNPVDPNDTFKTIESVIK